MQLGTQQQQTQEKQKTKPTPTKEIAPQKKKDTQTAGRLPAFLDDETVDS